MTTILLQLHPAAAKYFKFHHDDHPNQPSPLRDHFRHLVLLVAKPHPTGVLPILKNKTSIKAYIPIRTAHLGFDARSSALFIPDTEQRLLDDLLIHLIDQEVNTTVDLYQEQKKQAKDAIEYVMAKYDIEESDGYSYDRAKKMNQRYRNRLNAQ